MRAVDDVRDELDVHELSIQRLVNPVNPPDTQHTFTYTMGKGAHETHHQIDSNYSFTHFSSELGMTLGWMKFIPFQTFTKAVPENWE